MALSRCFLASLLAMLCLATAAHAASPTIDYKVATSAGSSSTSTYSFATTAPVSVGARLVVGFAYRGGAAPSPTSVVAGSVSLIKDWSGGPGTSQQWSAGMPSGLASGSTITITFTGTTTPVVAAVAASFSDVSVASTGYIAASSFLSSQGGTTWTTNSTGSTAGVAIGGASNQATSAVTSTVTTGTKLNDAWNSAEGLVMGYSVGGSELDGTWSASAPSTVQGHVSNYNAASGEPTNSTLPTISGTLTVASTLSVSTGTWANSPTAYAYQWERCVSGSCSNISGATASTYTLASGDQGATIKVRVTAANASGDSSVHTAETTAVGAASSCDKYAATTGSDSNSGTLASPYATLDYLLAHLSSGQTGCLRAGTYGGSSDHWIPPANTTLTAYNGEAVTVQGWPDLKIAGVTLSNLNIDLDYIVTVPTTYCGNGFAPQAVTIDASNVSLIHNDIHFDAGTPSNERYNSDIGIGWQSRGAGLNGIDIEFNRIHNAGCTGDAHGHGVYVENVHGSTFADNWLYDIAGAGIQFFDGYKATDDDGPYDDTAYGNVMNNVGLGIYLYGENPLFQDVTTDHNVVTNTTHYAGFAGNTGTNSTITFTNSDGYTTTTPWPCDTSNSGCGSVTTSGLLNIDPGYVNASTGDFEVTASSLSGYGLPTLSQMP